MSIETVDMLIKLIFALIVFAQVILAGVILIRRYTPVAIVAAYSLVAALLAL